MPTYIGYSTINANKPRTSNVLEGIDSGAGSTLTNLNTGKKYKLTDAALVIQDFLNALNIRQGELPGNPSYGTTLWTFVFEPNTADVQFKLENEIQRVANLDPRMVLNQIRAYPQENGILIELQMDIAPFNQPQTLSIFFNNSTNQASLQ